MANKKLNRKIGKKITKVRKTLHLSQTELANQLDISLTSMNNIEKGKQSCSVDKLAYIKEISEVTWDDLLP